MGVDALGLRAFGESRGLRTFAYGAVGEPGPSIEILTNPSLRRIGRETEEVALRWALQNGCAVRLPVCLPCELTCDAGLSMAS
jgi:diketogulonate reductase-like aldo/keto reductase